MGDAPKPESTPEPKPESTPGPASDPDAWIETVVRAAGALGMNRVRVRWKLMRWQEDRRRARRRREQWVTHVRYQHKTCPECGHVQDRDEKVCTACRAVLTGRRFQVLQRIGLTGPELLSMSTLLALALLGAYLREWIAAGGGLRSPSGTLLRDLGGHWSAVTAEEPWRLVTAVFLHAGLTHLGFNLLAIATIGPRIEALYGRLTMLMLFVVTGTLANLGSDLMGLTGVGIGASGGVMGLVGVAAGHGQRQGTAAGRALRDDMLKWAAYTLVFGFWIHADNWAHGYGLVLGAGFGYAVRPDAWARPRLLPVRVLGKLIGAAGAIGALAIIFTRTPSPPDGGWRSVDEGAELARSIDMCRAYSMGVPLDQLVLPRSDGGDSRAAVESLCDWVYGLREYCRTDQAGPGGQAGSASSGPEALAEEQLRALCRTHAAALSRLPPRPARPVQPGSF